jgi:16S rRNA (cytosine967-C5)-methyltransferase
VREFLSRTSGGRRPSPQENDPRRQAVAALVRVEEHGAHAARLLSDAPPATRELVLGSLRWQLTLDHLLRPLLHTPLASLDAALRAGLRVGLYEAKRMGTPAAVAVSEAVRVAKALAPRGAGLVNAVLRRAVAAPWPDRDDVQMPLDVRVSHPAWLVSRWQGLLGDGAARAAFDADQEPAPLCLLAAATRRDELESEGCRLAPHPLVPGVLVCSEGAAAAVAALRAGRAYAMDPTAVAVARLLPEVAGTVVDLAAAPGGKSIVLAVERRRTAHLALDRSLGRAVLMRRNLACTPGSARVAAVVADGGAPPLRPGSCAAVVLDAPCSGTGTLRRHPEIRWRLRVEDLACLAAAQRDLARAAAALLAPGGFLLYATCSLEPEENAEVVGNLDLSPVAVDEALPEGVPFRTLGTGGIVIAPNAWGDGFTAHLLRRDS